MDDIAVGGTIGGTAYQTFGLSSAGAVVVIRPDGYIGTIASLDEAETLTAYFGRFLKSLA